MPSPNSYLLRVIEQEPLLTCRQGFVFAYVACWTAAISAGSGRHQATLTIDEFDRSVCFLMIGMVPGVLSLALPKFAVVSLLVKILFPSPRHVRLLWGLAIGNLVLMLGAFGVRFSECDPPSARWTAYAPAKCRNSTAIIVYSVVAGSFSALVDFYLALYPAVVLWSLQLHLKKKLALSVALGFGVCAGCAAIRKVMMVPGMGDGRDYTCQMEKRRTRDEVEERMEAVLLPGEPNQDEESGQTQRVDNVRQRRLQRT
ncbi:integral membrane protein PTH11 [Fusarium sp. NRRL 52700]|nr:integral membrane protein PTH11 [Fusarium sp. NRRL 52700]